MWSLSPHLRADHMGNSMKIRMRFIQNMQWRQQDDMRKPFGSPPPRRSFFPRARDATMGFEYRPVR